MTRARLLDLAIFVAAMATVLALGGALAHLYELPNKIDLEQADYFTVQAIYRGWWQLAFVLAIQVAALVSVIVLARDETPVRQAATLALGCLVVAQAIFWSFTEPANAATSNWTVQPVNWRELRVEWEYSHAAGALLQLGAAASLLVAALARGRTVTPVDGNLN